METKELFNKYEDLKRTVKKAEEELKELKPLLAEHVPEDTEVSTGTAIFTLSKGKPRWKYSDAINELSSELKEQQGVAQKTGQAEQVYGKPFIICNLK